MKFKKILISASALAAGSSLIATALVSCGSKDVDEDLKMELNDEGLLAKNTTFQDAIKYALLRSSNWTTFKSALADEVVFKWYSDRMAEKKDSAEKNTSFRINYDDWKYQIEKDYDNIVSTCKTKYGTNWEFYLQNDYLAQYGGTKDNYIHAKLVDKVKSEFVTKVFATNYFGYRTDDKESTVFPRAYTKATTSIDSEELNNPENWSKLGFYARTNSSYTPTVKDRGQTDIDYLSKNPDGDYAAIQNYVFNRWFKTEKPFFSAAALFKYSEPKHVANAKMAEIYDGTYTGAKIPDKPSEAFPFFGFSEYGKGTKAFAKWYQKLADGDFEADKYQKEGQYYANGTVSIPKDVTEDSQTLLLCTASTTLSSLYTPYALAANHLYTQMLGLSKAENAPNITTQDNVAKTAVADTEIDNFSILSNFFFTADPTTSGIKSFLDLSTVYGGNTEGVYHCPIFKECKDYTHLYGTSTQNGVRYITNNIEVELGKTKTGGGYENTQPWILELNEAGVHAQTIDGYQYVQYASSEQVPEAQRISKQEATKNVIKYRLMQKKCGYNKDIISCDLLDDNGKLKTYFNDNFANIILEMAQLNTDENIFKPLEDYKKEPDQASKLLKTVIEEQKLVADAITAYINAVIGYERTKKVYDAVVAGNTKIYDYRKKQIENSKFDPASKTIFENGLLAPIVYEFESKTAFESTRCYTSSIKAMILDDELKAEGAYTISDVFSQYSTVYQQVKALNIDATKVNDTENGFSPLVKDAKDKKSNRFWYRSYMIDKLMYSYMGAKMTANGIKISTYDKYRDDSFKDEADANKIFENTIWQNALVSSFINSKMISGDKNYSYYGTKNDTVGVYRTNMQNAYALSLYNKMLADGYYCDEVLSDALFNATIAYLYKDNFANFYKVMSAKISDDEKALIGYVDKFDTNHDPDREKGIKGQITENPLNYTWSADVNNIFDQHHYTGTTTDADAIPNARIACDQYWNVVTKKLGTVATDIPLAGFTGLQTKASNQLDSSSGLQNAAFANFAQSSYKAWDVNTGTQNAQNDGCWFAWEGIGEPNEAGTLVPYTFTPVAWVDSSKPTISANDFSGDKQVMLKLAKRIAGDGTIDSLRTLAKNLGESFMGDSEFKKMGNGTFPFTTKDVLTEMKYRMLDILANTKDAQGNNAYVHCFKRITNIELHRECTSIDSAKWFFEDKNMGYKLLMTQLNKSDVIEKRLAPTWDETANTWVQGSSPLTPEEFFFIFNKMALESSVQQLVIAEAVKNAYGSDKLVVYDAQLYNQFDSVWIKDWKKKPIGGEGK